MVHKVHLHLAKKVILPVIKKHLVKQWMTGTGIHKKKSMKITSPVALKLAHKAKKMMMKGSGFWDDLKNVGSSIIKHFTDTDTLKRIFLDPQILTAAVEGLASGNPLESLGAVAGVIAKNTGVELLRAGEEGISKLGNKNTAGTGLRRKRKTTHRKKKSSPVVRRLKHKTTRKKRVVHRKRGSSSSSD